MVADSIVSLNFHSSSPVRATYNNDGCQPIAGLTTIGVPISKFANSITSRNSHFPSPVGATYSSDGCQPIAGLTTIGVPISNSCNVYVLNFLFPLTK